MVSRHTCILKLTPLIFGDYQSISDMEIVDDTDILSQEYHVYATHISMILIQLWQNYKHYMLLN